MASLGRVGGLSDDEYADLEDRVDRFHAAWTPDGAADLDTFLPAAGTRHRPHVLVEMIKTDLERRAQAGLSVRIEPYLARFPRDLPPAAVPVSLLVEEYRLRHRHGDRPRLDEYLARFPAQAAAFAEQLRHEATIPPQARPGTVGIDAADRTPDAHADSDRTVATPSRSRSRPPRAQPAPFEASDSLPADVEYQLGRPLGKGTFGEVFEAIAPGGFRVAVKRILREVDHPASKSEIEALDAMKAMAHPFLIQTHAYWVFRDRLVIVMELADGSLAGRVEHYKKQGLPGVPPEELIPFFEQAAEALDYLHSQNVSHRDVKPENLLLLKGYAKVADFGLAREHMHSLTLVGAEVGTPMYMAPEVWSRKVSLHSDQYSLAGTYVTARLGRPMFAARLLHELCYHHLHEAPNLEGLPPAEQQVLLKAMAKKPEDRYPNCVAFARALRAAVLEPPAPPRPNRRVAVGLLVASAVVFGTAAGVAVKWFTPPPVPPAPPPPPWCPAGWSPVADALTTTVDGGPEYHNRLTRTVAGETLVAVLIVPNRPADPPPFYMLRDKVTNRVFRDVWESGMSTPDSQIKQAYDQKADLFPAVWRVGPKRTNGDPLGIDGGQAGVPVVGVTAPEAMLVAEALGGQLPTYQQWYKAVGAGGDDPGPGPAGPPRRWWEVLSHRPLALGVPDGPWPVERPTKDVSVHGIHQLTSNGFEWADGEDEARRVTPVFPLRSISPRLPVTGETWEVGIVQTLKWVRDNRPPLTEWDFTKDLYGFRVVLTPR